MRGIPVPATSKLVAVPLNSFSHHVQGWIRFITVSGGFLVLWQGAITLFAPASYLLPAPAAVFAVFVEQTGYMMTHLALTVSEMLLGLAVGSALGILTAILLIQSRTLEIWLMPVVTTTQTLPVFAIAPLLVIWFGFGLGSKVVMASLIIYFPVASSFFDGLKSTPLPYLDLARTWRMSRFDQMIWIRIPAALPSLATGLKVAATLAPIGAVVGEWAGAAGGLGFVMLQANARTQTEVVFAALILLAISAWILRWGVVWLTSRWIWWHQTV